MSVIQLHISPNKKPVERISNGIVDSKTGEYKGRQNIKSLRYPPKQFIPYSYTAYVQKIDDGANYKGQIKFLSLNEEGGEFMEIRYLQGCPSLDRKWQEAKGYKPVNAKDGMGEFFQGATFVDIPEEPTNLLYRMMISNHPNNSDNPHRPKTSPVYFKVRNGKNDVDSRKAKMLYEKKLADFKLDLATDDNTAEVFSIIYKIKPEYELNVRREKVMEKFDEPNGVESVMKRASDFFEALQNTFQHYLNNNVIEVVKEEVIFKADKKPLGLSVKLGANPEKYAELFVKKCNKDHEILSAWLEIEKKLNNKN